MAATCVARHGMCHVHVWSMSGMPIYAQPGPSSREQGQGTRTLTNKQGNGWRARQRVGGATLGAPAARPRDRGGSYGHMLVVDTNGVPSNESSHRGTRGSGGEGERDRETGKRASVSTQCV